jgi:hypothetical protein
MYMELLEIVTKLVNVFDVILLVKENHAWK